MIKSDFSDRFSPMMVKELRQGLRSGVFVAVFLFVQGLMIFCVFLTVAAAGARGGESSADFLFWMVNGILLLVAMPVRGLNGHSGEAMGKTLELLLFTGLTPGKIARGKWKAIVAQTAIVTCSVLPYVVLRYFIGGVDPLVDLLVLGALLTLSIMLTAFSVAISPLRSMAGKLIIFAMSLFLFPMILGGVIAAVEGAPELLIFTFPMALIFFLATYGTALGRREATGYYATND
ncbi:MAG TPA: hypothetical protein VG733_00990 [Chthoniobacteraceae bacterium]|nr:hypothetical protein [Chthoniobacteraceae bacterium]